MNTQTTQTTPTTDTPVRHVGHPKKDGEVRIVLSLTEAQHNAVKRMQVIDWERRGFRGDMIGIADVLLGLVPDAGKKGKV